MQGIFAQVNISRYLRRSAQRSAHAHQLADQRLDIRSVGQSPALRAQGRLIINVVPECYDIYGSAGNLPSLSTGATVDAYRLSTFAQENPQAHCATPQSRTARHARCHRLCGVAQARWRIGFQSGAQNRAGHSGASRGSRAARAPNIPGKGDDFASFPGKRSVCGVAPREVHGHAVAWLPFGHELRTEWVCRWWTAAIPNRW